MMFSNLTPESNGMIREALKAYQLNPCALTVDVLASALVSAIVEEHRDGEQLIPVDCIPQAEEHLVDAFNADAPRMAKRSPVACWFWALAELEDVDLNG